MKKIFAIVLAFCLVLLFSMTAFATGSSSPDSPVPGRPSDPINPDNLSVGKSVWNATTDDGLPVKVIVREADKNSIPYQALVSLGVTIYLCDTVEVDSRIPDSVMLNIDIYSGDISDDAIIIVYDTWEVLSEVTFERSSDARVTVHAPAGIFKKWPYIAIVSGFNVVDVENPQEEGQTGEESEDVGETTEVFAPEEEEPVDNTPEVTAPETDEKNPSTGVVLAVLPMVLSAVVAVVSKRR